jgi:hypothetical protein
VHIPGGRGLGLGQEQTGAIQGVANIAGDKIGEAIALLGEYRNASGFGPGAVRKGGEWEAACGVPTA